MRETPHPAYRAEVGIWALASHHFAIVQKDTDMRIIKFRAWSITSKKMLDRVLAGPGDPCSIVWDEGREEWLNFDEFCGSIMQFTGLTDKNGKEMYEGDIVMWDEGQYTITFSQQDGSWILKDDRDDWECPSLYGVSSPAQSRIEVIGNIYETV